MNVLYILDYGTVGGATHSFLEMVVALKHLGVNPVVCLGKDSEITKILDQQGITYIHAGHRTVLDTISFNGYKWPYRLLKRTLRFWINEQKALYRLSKFDMYKIDLIHTNSARNDIGCFLNKKYGIPHVMHIREFADTDFGCISFRPNYISIYNRYTTRFISISNAVKHHWINKGIIESKITTIYNGIHYEDITVSTDKDKEKDDLRILIAGGVYPTKGQHLAVEAIGLLPKDVRDHFSLDIAGWSDLAYIQKMKEFASERGYISQIHFLGSIDDVHERIGNYQIGLMCSKAEGFGRVTAEYMHGRLGVIASDSGANPELIENKVTGMLFKSGDASSLAKCLMKLYNDRELLISISNAAQKKARQLYTQQKNAEYIYKLYQQVLDNRK